MSDDTKIPENKREFGSFLKGFDKKAQKRKRRRSIQQEDRIAGEIGGRRVPGSGNKAVRSDYTSRGATGDVDSRDFKVEAKYTDKKSYRIDEQTILKVFFEAETEGKDWVLQVDVHGFDSAGPNKFAILDWDVFVELLRKANGISSG